MSLPHESLINIVNLSLGGPASTIKTSKVPEDDCNNHVYFIHHDQNTYVLKVANERMDGQRVENEVRSLRLSEEYCPSIPVPKVISWSPDGKRIIRGDTGLEVRDLNEAPPWILMTCLPGRPLDLTLLSLDETETLVSELAEIVTAWRKQIPKARSGGNVLSGLPFLDDVPTGHAAPRLRTPPLGKHVLVKTRSCLDYWTAEIGRVAQELQNRETSHLLDTFSKEKLPRQRLFHKPVPEEFVFTHTDLAPRNILVSGSKITGIVDFEFSGFFHVFEEFAPEMVRTCNWPLNVYQSLIRRVELLESAEVSTSEDWRQYLLLSRLGNACAPWWSSDPAGLQEEVESVISCLADYT